MEPLDLRQIGRRIAGKRVEHDLTQEQLARLADLSLRTITMIESGKRTGFSINTLAPIAQVLGVSLDYLVFGEQRSD